MNKHLTIWALAAVVGILFALAGAHAPPGDTNDDWVVDLEDFFLMVNQWLTSDPNIPYDIVPIPYGGFEMGNHFPSGEPNELPRHPVFLDAFFMGRYEITNQQYCAYLNSAYDVSTLKVDGGVVYASTDTANSYPYCDTSSYSPYSQIDFSGGVFTVRTKAGRHMSHDPMVQVSWYGSAAYCNWRSAQEGYQRLYDIDDDPNWSCDFSKTGYRLPTEAEWEYVARGRKHHAYRRFPWGDTIHHDYANYSANGTAYPYDTSPYTSFTFHPDWNDGIYPYTSVVGTFPPNGYYLHDLAGNVWEWCYDWHDETYYEASPYDSPQGPPSGADRVVRGGSWHLSAYHCRTARRYHLGPARRDYTLGFRVMLALK